jgi:hypothetical protein
VSPKRSPEHVPIRVPEGHTVLAVLVFDPAIPATVVVAELRRAFREAGLR